MEGVSRRQIGTHRPTTDSRDVLSNHPSEGQRGGVAGAGNHKGFIDTKMYQAVAVGAPRTQGKIVAPLSRYLARRGYIGTHIGSVASLRSIATPCI